MDIQSDKKTPIQLVQILIFKVIITKKNEEKEEKNKN